MIDKITNIALDDKYLSSEQLYRDKNLYIGWAFITSSRVHIHGCYELEFLVEGKGSNRINNSLKKVSSGSFWLCQPNDMHLLELEEECGKCLTIKFNDEIIGQKASSKLFQMQEFVGRLNEQEMQQIISQIELFVQLVKTIQKESEKEWFYSGFLEFLLAWCFGKQEESLSTSSDVEFDVRYENLLKVIFYIRKNTDKQIRVKDLCDICNYTPNYLSRLFKKMTGDTISDYINKEKMRKAISLMEASNYTITEISNLLGFLSPYYFSIVFKKYYKMSPSQYREIVKNESDNSK